LKLINTTVMKKIIICLVAVLFAAVTLSARPTGFNVGGGIDYLGWTQVNGNSPLDYVGPYVEVGYDLKVAKQSYIYFGGRFSHGLHTEPDNEIVGGNAVKIANMGDLFIPIRFQQNFQINPNGTTFYIEAGPAAGFLLYNYERTIVSSQSGAGTSIKDKTYDGEPRANVYLGGNIGFNIKKHVKIYAGGDYGFIPFTGKLFGENVQVNRWQLNIGACYVF